jgi:hypothetical protein
MSRPNSIGVDELDLSPLRMRGGLTLPPSLVAVSHAYAVANADYRRLELPPSKAEICVRVLTRGESISRQAKKAALPAIGLVGICAGTAGAIVGAPFWRPSGRVQPFPPPW